MSTGHEGKRRIADTAIPPPERNKYVQTPKIHLRRFHNRRHRLRSLSGECGNAKRRKSEAHSDRETAESVYRDRASATPSTFGQSIERDACSFSDAELENIAEETEGG
jgi:hypothetical protein